jgi:hypothetical protein
VFASVRLEKGFTMRTAAILAILLALTSNAVAQEEKKDCRVVRAEGTSFLEDCGTTLRSFMLWSRDLRHAAQRDARGRFVFHCPLEPMCRDEPKISGFFIEPENWLKGAKDDKAIFEASTSIPIAAGSRSAPPAPPPPPATTCPVFDLVVGSMPARAVCYAGDRDKWSAVIVVAADDKVGVVLVFFQADDETEKLRSKVLESVSRLSTQWATGDGDLRAWLR